MFTRRWLVLLFLVPGWQDSARAQEWTRFRGPNGSGLGTGKMPTRWTEKDLNWKVKLPGHGHSSPVLWGKKIFVTCGEGQTGKRILLCLRVEDGKPAWIREFPGQKHRQNADSSYASATPAVDERHVYVAWGSPADYLILALDHAGTEKWRTDLGPFKAGHGFGTSPIVHDGRVFVANDQDGKSSLLALDALSGKTLWTVPRKGRSSYATPCVFRPAGGPDQVIFTNYEHGITSLDAKTGQKLWEMDVFSKGHIESAIASPIVAGDLVLGTCGWLGVKKEVIAVRPDRTGGRVIYRLDKNAPLVTTPIVVGDLIFLWSDQGVVTCADLQTGKIFWQERVPGSYYGSPVGVAGHLYCMSREGDMVVLEAASKFRLLAQIPLGEGSHATPALAAGTMYLRTFTHLLAVGGK